MQENTKPNKNDVLVVRKINKAIYEPFKDRAMEENQSVGQALNEAMQYWLLKQDEGGRPDIKNIRKLEGIIKTDKDVTWSE